MPISAHDPDFCVWGFAAQTTAARSLNAACENGWIESRETLSRPLASRHCRLTAHCSLLPQNGGARGQTSLFEKSSRYARCTSTALPLLPQSRANTANSDYSKHPRFLSREAYASLDRIPWPRCSCFDRPTTHGYGRGAGWRRTPVIHSPRHLSLFRRPFPPARINVT
jgi:hypothetical protein